MLMAVSDYANSMWVGLIWIFPPSSHLPTQTENGEEQSKKEEDKVQEGRISRTLQGLTTTEVQAVAIIITKT